MYNWASSQLKEIQQGGIQTFRRKLYRLRYWPVAVIMFIPALLLVLLIRVISFFIIIRLGELFSSRIGHFSVNTELYFCEKNSGINEPGRRYIDIFFLEEKISNLQLAKMWKRVLHIYPRWIAYYVYTLNSIFPGAEKFQIRWKNSDRDIHSLIDSSPPTLSFTDAEEARGRDGLKRIGVPSGSKFVILVVRDSAYLSQEFRGDWSYHNYRDCSVQDFIKASVALADMGYYVIRMGAAVNEAFKVENIKIIDYATNGMRSDFMDIYLGAHCDFCISTSTGIDGIPLIFRKPIAFVNLVPIGYLWSFNKRVFVLPKKHFSVQNNRFLTLREIFDVGVGYALLESIFKDKHVTLIDNDAEDIRDYILEVVASINGSDLNSLENSIDQKKAKDIFMDNHATKENRGLHGQVVRAKFSLTYLKRSPNFLS